MSAPALVMIAPGSGDPRVAQVTHCLRTELGELRPEIIARAAFLDRFPPTPFQVVEELAALDVAEVVFVPLDVAHAVEVDGAVTDLVGSCRERFHDMNFVASRPVGPELNLLTILDERLRSALAAARVLELDGLVLSSESSGDVRGAALLARRARQWSTHHRLPCLTAVADGTGPSVAQAIAGLRSQGRRHIAVGSFFLTSDASYHLQADQAFRCGAVAVSDPIGPCREVSELVIARYAFAAMDLLDFEQRHQAFDASFDETDDFGFDWETA